jgi:L-threonylcarbamoyladenylate synthase
MDDRIKAGPLSSSGREIFNSNHVNRLKEPEINNLKMKTITVNLKKVSPDNLKITLDYLKKGKVVAYPTDTIYGLGCLVSEKKAIQKIRRIKGRENGKPMIVLVSSLTMLKKYFYVDKRQAAYLRKIWPGKVSVILKQKGLFGRELLGSAETAAVRLPKSLFLDKIIKLAGEPIVSTSLNLSGEKSRKDVNSLNSYFKTAKPDLAIDAGVLDGRPSKLIDLRDSKNIIILRK